MSSCEREDSGAWRVRTLAAVKAVGIVWARRSLKCHLGIPTGSTIRDVIPLIRGKLLPVEICGASLTVTKGFGPRALPLCLWCEGTPSDGVVLGATGPS